MQQKQKIQNLVNSINAFDIFYEMSDSSKKFEAGQKAKQQIERELKYFKIPVDKLTNMLDNSGKAVYDRYFNNREHKNNIRT